MTSVAVLGPTTALGVLPWVGRACSQSRWRTATTRHLQEAAATALEVATCNASGATTSQRGLSASSTVTTSRGALAISEYTQQVTVTVFDYPQPLGMSSEPARARRCFLSVSVYHR